MSRHEPENDPASDMGVSGFLARAVGGWVIDALVNGAVLFSLITLVAGFLTKEPTLTALGAVVGITGMAWPWFTVARKWPDRRVLVVVAIVILVDIAALALMWTTT